MNLHGIKNRIEKLIPPEPKNRITKIVRTYYSPNRMPDGTRGEPIITGEKIHVLGNLHETRKR